MAQQPQWGINYLTAVQNVISALEAARVLEDMLTQDATLPAKYLIATGARADIVAQDFTNASTALTQLLFTFDSGSPTQKSYLFKMT